MGTGQYKILFSQTEIQKKVGEIAKRISIDYRDKTPVFVGILKGAFVFLSDLVRCIEGIDLEIDFLGVCSYGNNTSPAGKPVITKDITIDITGRDVIVIEDIVDTGSTFQFVINHIRRKNPSSLQICALVDKRGRRKEDVEVNYIGFELESGFVIGYGMDFSEKYRNIKDILLFCED